jgi:hypothetical protein
VTAAGKAGKAQRAAPAEEPPSDFVLDLIAGAETGDKAPPGLAYETSISVVAPQSAAGGKAPWDDDPDDQDVFGL